MNLHLIESGYFKLDGGAMFGVVPKAIWSRFYEADAKNRIQMAAKSLLIEDGDKLILIDTGLGNKQSEKFFSHFDVHPNVSLFQSLKNKGFHPDDITDVFLTHLHFDHCGGAVQFNLSKHQLEPSFKNAKYWSNQAHWDWALQPNPRERASFLVENFEPIQAFDQLHLINHSENKLYHKDLRMEILMFDGHTERQMLPVIKYKEKKIVFAADLIPTINHIPLPYVMAYDVQPLLSMKEKESFLESALNQEYILFLQHDARYDLCTLKKSDKGVVLDQTFSFDELLKN